MFYIICAILDAVIATLLFCYNVELNLSICVMAGVLVSEIFARVTFHWFFYSMEEYSEAWHYDWQWDIVSLIKGELMKDWAETSKLGFYHLLIVVPGIVTFFLLLKWLCPNFWDNSDAMVVTLLRAIC